METVSDVSVSNRSRLAVSVAAADHGGFPFELADRCEVDVVLFEVGARFGGVPLVMSVVCVEAVDHLGCGNHVLILFRCTA